ncbi:MAG: hypothetical protein ACT6U0_08390 [Shinella sp.]|uniref:hypothetical protein n=1 Tax=Shinella sp. TaxID=1870904 RepID=UPI00403605D1
MKTIMPSGAGRETYRQEMRATVVGGKAEVLPADPREVARILRERRSKTPASRAKARMTAEAKKRGI